MQCWLYTREAAQIRLSCFEDEDEVRAIARRLITGELYDATRREYELFLML